MSVSTLIENPRRNHSYLEWVRELARKLDVVLENDVRKELFLYIFRKGFGIFNEMWRELGCSKATLSWHRNMLRRCGIVGELRISKYKILYIVGCEKLAIRRFMHEKRGSRFRWDRVRRLLMDMCYVDNDEVLAKRYGLDVDEVKGLRQLLRASVGDVRGRACLEKLFAI